MLCLALPFKSKIKGGNMRNHVVLTIILVLFISLLSACGAPEPTPAPTPVPPTPAPKVEASPTPVPPTPTPEVEAGPPALVIKGQVAQELSLTMDDLKGQDVVKITAEHPKRGQEEYEGVRLKGLLEKAEVQEGATALVFTADDGYSIEVPLADVQGCNDCLAAFRAEGGLLTVMPGMPSNTWVKGVISIELK
jgi:hypothetical protein